MENLAHRLIQMINPDAKIVPDRIRRRPLKSEVERLMGSNSKLAKLTGWKPRCTLERGLKETIEWFGKNRNAERYKCDIYNV